VAGSPWDPGGGRGGGTFGAGESGRRGRRRGCFSFCAEKKRSLGAIVEAEMDEEVRDVRTTTTTSGRVGRCIAVFCVGRRA
jgi:hypothetical protein